MPKIRDTFVNASKGWFVLDDKSGVRINGRSFRSLKDSIISHRKANNIEWSNTEVEDMIHRQVCERESPSYCRDINGKTGNKANPVSHNSHYFSMWRDLHKAALGGYLDREWLKQWEKRIPIGKCACRRHWKQVKSEVPFEPTFLWTYKTHNVVNRLLGKTQIPLEKALQLWS